MGAHGGTPQPQNEPRPQVSTDPPHWMPDWSPNQPNGKRPRGWRAVTVGLAALACGVIGYAAGDVSADTTTTAAAVMPQATHTVRITVSPKSRTASTTRPTASPSPKPAVIRDGVWTVGDDVRPGTYKVMKAITGDTCFWFIYRTGTNQADIIQSDAVIGGRPAVVLRIGQDFKSSSCGVWVRQ